MDYNLCMLRMGKMNKEEKMIILKRTVCIYLFGCLLLSVAVFAIKERMVSGAKIADSVTGKAEQEVFVKKLDFTRVSKKKIRLTWEIENASLIENYLLKRRETQNGQGTGSWIEIRRIEGSLAKGKKKLSVVDQLEKAKPQQYEYRVDVLLKDESSVHMTDGTAILASNVMICIDPGHYKGKNKVTGEKSYRYVEGNFTLKIAKALKKELKRQYGIDSYMTRTTGTITMGGYTNDVLDSAHISLRGEYAGKKKSNLFVSLHTNANLENANGYPTNMQPLAINKTILIANQPACESDTMIRVCNAIGQKLTVINKEMGLSVTEDFRTVAKGEIPAWTDEYNDQLRAKGTVVYRKGNNGDYYGVLRGAANAGVPGVIIEHGMHTVAKLRKKAKNSDLDKLWGDADAYGIACGIGFCE